MFILVKKYLIGGKSGKREMGIIILVLWCLGWHYYPTDRALIITLAFPVLAFIASVYGMEWAGTQSPWAKKPTVEEFAPYNPNENEHG